MDTVVCLTLAKWETVSGQFGGYLRDHLGEMVRGTVEETLNALLDAEADLLCGAGRYERSQARQDTQAGSYERTLHTSAGEVNLKIPKLRRQSKRSLAPIYLRTTDACDGVSFCG
jgi:transposase-like protein